MWCDDNQQVKDIGSYENGSQILVPSILVPKTENLGTYIVIPCLNPSHSWHGYYFEVFYKLCLLSYLVCLDLNYLTNTILNPYCG